MDNCSTKFIFEHAITTLIYTSFFYQYYTCMDFNKISIIVCFYIYILYVEGEEEANRVCEEEESYDYNIIM